MSDTDRVRGTVAVRALQAARAVAWKHPFFLPGLSALSIIDDETVPTACVDLSGLMRINPTWGGKLTDAELAGVVCHEIMHLYSLHFARQQGRDQMKWNKACDRAIDSILREAQIKLPSGALYPQKSEHNTLPAETLYEYEEEEDGDGPDGGDPGKDPGPGPGKGKGKGPGRPGNQPGNQPGNFGQGCGPLPAPGGDQQKQENERKWREAAITAATMSRGQGKGDAFSKLLEAPAAKTPWARIVQQACLQAVMAHGREDHTWQRRSRRSTADVILPGWTAYKAQVAVMIDTSGSMSDDNLAEAISNTIAIARASGVKLFLVTHDDGVQWSGWIQPSARFDAIAPALKGRGGTDFTEAYQTVAKEKAKFDAAIHLTDGCCSWPDPYKPSNVRRLIVALLGSKYTESAPKAVDVQVIDASL